MKNLRRFLFFLIVVLLIYFLIVLCVHFLSKGYTNTYIIDKYEVTEIYTKNEQHEHNNYYVEIEANNIWYNFQFYREFKDNNKIVKDILFYDGDYKCLLPILSDDVHVDFQCYKDKEYYNYQDIKGKDSKLDKYINKLSKEKNNEDMFKDNKKDSSKYGKITYYKNNLPDGYILSFTDLKGVVSLNNKKIVSNEIFDNDSYSRELSAFYDYYYVSADYNAKQNFSEVYVLNMLTGKKKILKTPDYISFDSYIQGVVDGCVYLYDINNEKQYKINIKESLVTEVGNAKKEIRYYNNGWTTISSIRANNKVLFKIKETKTTDYYYLIKDGEELSGFYYYFYENENGYSLYRVNVQDKSIRKYLFDVKNINDVVFYEDYIFFKDDNAIKSYSDYTGIKTIVVYNELEYNDNIKFNAYVN